MTHTDTQNAMNAPVLSLLVAFINGETLSAEQLEMLMRFGHIAFSDTGRLEATPAGYAALNVFNHPEG